MKPSDLLIALTAVSFLPATSVRAEERSDTLDMVCLTGLQDQQYRELRRMCTDHFPELQGPMEEAQAAWAQRNAAAVAQFDAVCGPRLSDLDRNHAAEFEASREKAHQLMEHILEEMRKTGELESTCRDYVEGIRLPGMMDVSEVLLEKLVLPGHHVGQPDGPAAEPDDLMGEVKIIATPAPAPAVVHGTVPAGIEPCAAAGGYRNFSRRPPCTADE